MEASPLTLQVRPTSFQPKIDRLYEDLFRQDDEGYADADGFWGEFFLLNPDKASLQRRLEALTTEDLLQLQDETQQLFVRAIQQIKSGKSPTDEHALDVCRIAIPCAQICHLLVQTLTVFLGVILTKRYTNPSADIITALSGLDEVDAVFFEFANAIEGIIRTGGSRKSLKLAPSSITGVNGLQWRFVIKLLMLLYL